MKQKAESTANVALKKKKESCGKKSFSEEWECLPHAFLETTLQRAAIIRKALSRLKINSIPATSAAQKKIFEELKLTFHKISGSSGIYGYDRIGQIARNAEETLVNAEENRSEIDEAIMASLVDATKEMEALLNEAMESVDVQSFELKADSVRSQTRQGQGAVFDDESTMKPARILVVDDDEMIQELVERNLTRAGYTVKTASDGKGALEEVFRFTPDMVILDIMLPDIDGLDLLKILRQKPGGSILPIMFLTAKTDLNDRIHGLSVGGDDYITKPFYPEELVARVGALIARTTLLKELAVRDGLTGTYNHRYFYEKLKDEITRWKRYKRKFTLVIIDLDFFKNVNDTYGHMVGDTVLRETASFLIAQLRSVDVVARYGGEEFALILPETDLKDAHLVLRRIFDKMKEWKIRHPSTDEYIQITFSAGLATCPEDGDDEKALVSHADKALYYAKESGRNQFILYRDLVTIMKRNRDADDGYDASEIRQDEKGTIYIAEDDHLISNMLKLYLEKEGYRISVFPNGAELLAIINIEKPDLILLDVMMPLMDGMKVLEIIKSQDDVKNIPIIMLTSLDDRTTMERHKQLGAVDYVRKPFNPEILIKVIQKYIN
jgi:diguanylate cyclase (GGDEF)-like protein